MTTTTAPDIASPERLTVLIVEDDYLIAKEAAILLRDHGAKVLGPIPNAARALASDNAPDCVLLDSFQEVPYLQKPLEPRALIATVKQAAESSSLKRSGDVVR